MKVRFLLPFFLLCCRQPTLAQDNDNAQYQHMYKKPPAVGAAVAKTPPLQPSATTPEYADTSRVIGFAIAPLYKKQPESPLGNLMADAMKWYAQKMYDTAVDAAFVNFSSMRSYLPKGNITVGAVMRVMPYDNKIVLLQIPGSVLRQFLQHTATLGGWPAAGINLSIQNQSVGNILINNQPLNDSATYLIAVADYIANGGNQCIMLKGLRKIGKNILLRIALLDYISSFTKAGKPVAAAIENRVVYINE